MTREIPQHWAHAMESVGATDPRNGRPSMRRLAEMTDSSTSTISYMIHGGRNTDAEIISRVAKELRLPLTTVYEWVGVSGVSGDSFMWPREVDQLSDRQRRAVRELIRSMVDPEGESRGRKAVQRRADDEPLPQDAYRLAAEEGTSSGRQGKLDSDERGEESQDSEQQAED